MASFLRCASAVFITILTALSSVNCEETLDIVAGHSTNLGAGEGTASIRYTCPDLGMPNTNAEVDIPPMPAAGASTSFYIEVHRLRTIQEVKFTVFEDPNLRWSRHGKRADWVVQVGRRQKRLGPSKILPGNGLHSVTIVSGTTSVTVLEDGKVVGNWKREKDTISHAFEMQVCPTDAHLDISVTGIQVHGDFVEAALPQT